MIDETETKPPAEEELDVDVDPALADLTDLLSQSVAAGDAVDVENYAAQYPALADSIRQIVPTIRGLVSLGRSIKRCDAD